MEGYQPDRDTVADCLGPGLSTDELGQAFSKVSATDFMLVTHWTNHAVEFGREGAVALVAQMKGVEEFVVREAIDSVRQACRRRERRARK